MGIAIHGEFNIDVVNRDGTVYLEIDGDLDLATAPLLDKQLVDAHASDTATIVIDLTRVSFIDSTGLRSLLAAQSHAKRDGDRLRITGSSDQALRLFMVAGVMEELSFLAAPGD